MLLTIPIDSTDALFRRKGARRMLEALARERSTTITRLASLACVSAKAVWMFVKDLEKTEHVERIGKRFRATDMIQSDHIIVNLRDVFSSLLFRHRITPLLLRLLIMREGVTLREASTLLSASYKTVKRAMSLLRSCGVVSRNNVRVDLLRMVDDSVALVPRRVHRQAIRHLLNVVEEQYPRFSEPLVLYGDASWGKNTFSMDLLALSRAAYPPERYMELLKALVSASSSVTFQFGTIVNITFSTEDVWLAQSLGFVSNPHPIINAAFEGICVHGKLPEAEDYFSLMDRALHYSPERIKKLLESGYIIEKNGKLVHTEKALKLWKESKKSELYEQTTTFDGKNIKVISIMPPTF